MIGRLSLNTEDWVDVGVVTTSHSSNKLSELFIVNLAVAVSVKSLEETLELYFLKDATKSLKDLLKLVVLNCTETVEVKVLKDLLNSFPLIISSMSALSNLLENDSLKLV